MPISLPRSLACALLPLAAACSSGQDEAAAPDDKIVVITGGHSSASQEDFRKSSFPCCSDPAITAVISDYVRVMDALAGDDADAARQAAARLAVSAQAPMPAPAQARTQKLASLVGPWAGDDIEGMRADLTMLAAEALPLAAGHRGEGGLTVAVAFCPMAPGRWLQSNPSLRNPYFGAQMLTCGVFEEPPSSAAAPLH